MVVISSVLAYFIASGANLDWSIVAFLSLGGMAITGAANSINQVLEKDFDSQMKRTMYRPVAAGRMKISEAVLFSGILLVIGICCLAMINPLASFFGMASFVIYAFVYTPLKRYSTVSVAVGAIPGAMPVLIGVVAANGGLTSLAIALFMVQFLWQFPHFWAISFLSFEDYDRAGFKLLPKDKDGSIDKNLGYYSALYSALIIPVALWLQYGDHPISIFSLAIIIGLTVLYTMFGLRLQFKPSRKSALALMFSSFFYLPLILIFYLIG